jgi:hypothetical protein
MSDRFPIPHTKRLNRATKQSERHAETPEVTKRRCTAPGTPTQASHRRVTSQEQKLTSEPCKPQTALDPLQRIGTAKRMDSRIRVGNARVGSATRSTTANCLTSRTALSTFFATHHVSIIFDCLHFVCTFTVTCKRTQTHANDGEIATISL